MKPSSLLYIQVFVKKFSSRNIQNCRRGTPSSAGPFFLGAQTVYMNSHVWVIWNKKKKIWLSST